MKRTVGRPLPSGRVSVAHAAAFAAAMAAGGVLSLYQTNELTAGETRTHNPMLRRHVRYPIAPAGSMREH